MNKTLLSIAFLLIVTHAVAKDSKRDTAAVFSCLYYSFEEAINKNGAYPNTFAMKQRGNNVDMPLYVSYNAIKITADCVNSKITDQTWGISFNDTIYINKRLLGNIGGFAKVHTSGRYMVIFIKVPDNTKVQKRLMIPEHIITEHNKQKAAWPVGSVLEAMVVIIASTTSRGVYFPLVIDTNDCSVLILR